MREFVWRVGWPQHLFALEDRLTVQEIVEKSPGGTVGVALGFGVEVEVVEIEVAGEPVGAGRCGPGSSGRI
jgi:hypothetical protein